MNKSIIFILVIFLIGCDCIQQVKGYVIDAETGIPIEGVRIWKDDKTEQVLKTNKDGYFKYFGISGGILKCPNVELVFKKEGFKLLKREFTSSNKDTFEVRLVKDLDLLGEIRSEILDTVLKIEIDNFISSGVLQLRGQNNLIEGCG